MKKILFLIFTVFFISCGNQDPTRTILSDMTGESSSDTRPSGDFVLEQTANFSSRGIYSVSGTAELFYSASTNTYSLYLSNFTADNGPNLKVYLSQDETEVNITDLGALKAFNGEQRYDFPAANYNISRDNVLIWCDAISQNFGVASF